MKKCLLIFLILLIPIIPLASACIDIQLGRTNYFPYETFQAEITGNFGRALDNSNIFFYQNDKAISLAFHKEQMAANKYIVYANLPSGYGSYTFAVKNVFCIENKTTKVMNKESPFIISKPLSQVYYNLSSKVSKWPSGDDGALALLALSYDNDLVARGKAALLANSNNGECWPKDSCAVKSTSLAVLALSKTGNVSKNWLLDSQNNIKIGLWDLIINSSIEQQCNFTINDNSQALNVKTGDNVFTLNLPDEKDITLKLECNNVSAFVSHTYFGSVNKFSFDAGYSLTLNNNKCFGKGYRENCDSEATAYALLTLMNLGMKDSDAEAWLKDNMKGTVQKSIYFILTSDNSIKDWLVNNQAHQGYWSTDALALVNESSIEATVFAFEALKNEGDILSTAAVEKAKAWLPQQFSSVDNFGDIYQTSLVLAYMFKPDQIEPLISIEPALFKTKSGNKITLKITNHGVSDAKGTVSFEESRLGSFSVNKSSSNEFIFATPQKSRTTFATFIVQYSSFKTDRSYSIPVLLWPADITESAIEQSVKESELNKSILPESIRFLEENISMALDAGQKFHLNIYNPSSKSDEASILPSWNLLSENVIDVYPAKVTLLPNETKEITVTVLNKTGTFSGTIDAKTQTSAASVPLYLEIKEKGKAEEKTCSDLNGKVCGEKETCKGNATSMREGLCCLGACEATEGKKSNTALIIGIVLLVIVIAGVALFLRSRLKKRPKKEIIEELKKIEEKYSPASH
jgi:hypothetical protein